MYLELPVKYCSVGYCWLTFDLDPLCADGAARKLSGFLKKGPLTSWSDSLQPTVSLHVALAVWMTLSVTFTCLTT